MKIKSILLCLFLLGSLTVAHAQEDASAVLQTAYTQAKKENKKVFVIFHASWCGWCKKMEKNMESPSCKKLFDNNYVTTFLTVQESPKNKNLENPGAADLLTKYKASGVGIPFWVILDTDGTVLADAFNSKGENLGCPATAEEVGEFLTKLKKTSKLTKAQLDVISQVFTIKK